jgi:hypothetical protein
MMVRTGAVVSGALDANDELSRDFLECWEALIDHGLSGHRAPGTVET